MAIEVRIGSREPNDPGKVVGAIMPANPGAFRDYDPVRPSILSIICAPDERSAEVYRFRQVDFVANPHIVAIPGDMYTEENLEATLEPGEETDGFESDIVTKAGHAAHLTLRLMAPGEMPG